jgi:hypothetical protein
MARIPVSRASCLLACALSACLPSTFDKLEDRKRDASPMAPDARVDSAPAPMCTADASPPSLVMDGSADASRLDAARVPIAIANDASLHASDDAGGSRRIAAGVDRCRRPDDRAGAR